MKTDRKVVVTGIGVLSPVGIGREAFWNALVQGKTGFRTISLFDASQYPVSVAGEITDFDPVLLLGKKGLRTLDRSTKLICSATHLAVDDACLEITEDNTYTTGVAIGTTFGSLHSIFQFDREGLIEGPRYVNPSHFPNTVINSPASQVSIRFRIKGFNTTISTGFCASIDAVAYACDFMRLGRADVVLAGGVEELCEETFRGFQTLGCLSGSDGSDPLCCPFDARRNGIILAEGSSVLVLEDEEHALKRGARIMAKVLGYGNAFDPSANIRFSAEGKGLSNAINLAVENASLNPQDIDYISAAANSTKELDRMESEAIRGVLGDHAFSVPVSSIKSMVGETFSASGALSCAAAISSLSSGIIPPTVNYMQKDPGCDLDYVPVAARKKEIENVLVISSDPYGNNSAIVFSKYPD
jgi:3-oxoacyl-[acyl-carrier-protein] synthase II